MKYFTLFLFAILSLNAQAKVHSSDSNFWYVDNFYQYSNNASNLLQTNTGRNHSCGLTSILLVNNYFSVKNTGIYPSFTDSVSKATGAIDRLYRYLGYSTSQDTFTDDAKKIAKIRWNWSIAKKISGNNTMEYNLDKAAEWIKNDYPLIIALEGDFERSPVYKEDEDYKHVVILFAYKKNTTGNKYDDVFYWYDPYFGKVSGFYRYEAFDAIQGNAPFVRAAP